MVCSTPPVAWPYKQHIGSAALQHNVPLSFSVKEESSRTLPQPGLHGSPLHGLRLAIGLLLGLLHGDSRWQIASWPTWPQQGGRPWNWQPIWKPFKRCQWQLKPYPMASLRRVTPGPLWSPSGTRRVLSCCGKTSCMSDGARSKVETKSWAGGLPDTCPLGLLGQFFKGLASTKAVGRVSVGVPSGRGPTPHHRLQLAGNVPEGHFLPLCRVDCLLPLAVVWCREVLPSLTCYQRVPSLLVWFG